MSERSDNEVPELEERVMLYWSGELDGEVEGEVRRLVERDESARALLEEMEGLGEAVGGMDDVASPGGDGMVARGAVAAYGAGPVAKKVAVFPGWARAVGAAAACVMGSVAAWFWVTDSEEGGEGARASGVVVVQGLEAFQEMPSGQTVSGMSRAAVVFRVEESETETRIASARARIAKMKKEWGS
ncbi:MAG: hypothetical protein AAGD22_13965 [Verrucomicrobiota bacterium]